LKKKPFSRLDWSVSWRDTLITVLILSITTGLCFALWLIDPTDTYVSMIFLLAVVLVASTTNGYLYGLVASVMGVVGVNYAFTKPYFSFSLSLSGYPLTFGCMLIVSLVVSTLTTRLKQQEKERYARQAEEMRANLLRAVSHDLRTPLTSIQGAASLLSGQSDNLPAEQRDALLEQINEDAEWLIRMVENLLSITRISDGATRVHKKIEAAEEIIAEAVRKFRMRFSSLPVEVHLPDDLLLVPMDPILIEQVITNLLENAAYHARGATRVTVNLTADHDKAVFEIADDGKGIDPERLPTLFSSLPPASDAGRSMGIGLNVCHTIIAAHNGTMTARNRPEGGALLRFALPLKENPHESENQHTAR